eukprot:13787015-Alexandrium_andersonii.AAC.1
MKGVMEMAIIFGVALAILAGGARVGKATDTLWSRRWRRIEERSRGRPRRRIVMVNELAYEKRAAML